MNEYESAREHLAHIARKGYALVLKPEAVALIRRLDELEKRETDLGKPKRRKK